MSTVETERPVRSQAAKRAAAKESLQMREALAHVGELMRLPPKLPGAVTAAPAAKQRLQLPSVSGRVLWLPVAAIAAAAIFAIINFWPSSAPDLPMGLRREWATAHPKYAGSRIAFTERQVLLSSGGAQPTAYTIESVESTYRGDSTRLVINYKEDGGLTELRVSLVNVPTPKLIFARPEGLVWEPVAAP